MQKNYKLELRNKTIYLVPQEHKYSLIWIHGLGDTGSGFKDLFLSPNSPVPQTTRIVLPTAPTRPVTINFEMPSTSWFDIKSLDAPKNNDFENCVSLKEVEESKQIIFALIDEELKTIPSERIFIGGFSQGCCMALHCGLTYPKPLGGIIGLSGFLFPTTPFEKSNEETPIILSHGEKDIIISLSWASLSYKRFDATKSKRRFFDFGVIPNIGHELDFSTLAKIQGFFNVVLK